MAKLAFEDYWREIDCLLPVYDETGANCTRIIFSSGEEKEFLDQRAIKSVIKALARTFAVDLEALRFNYGSLVNRKTSLPLPLHPEFILVPMKTRVPQWADHGAWGYLVLDKIVGYRACEEPRKTEITFENGNRVTVLFSVTSVKAILNDAHILKTVYKNRLNPQHDTVKECAYHYYCTALKGKPDLKP
jgi:hypothetical protein